MAPLPLVALAVGKVQTDNIRRLALPIASVEYLDRRTRLLFNTLQVFSLSAQSFCERSPTFSHTSSSFPQRAILLRSPSGFFRQRAGFFPQGEIAFFVSGPVGFPISLFCVFARAGFQSVEKPKGNQYFYVRRLESRRSPMENPHFKPASSEAADHARDPAARTLRRRQFCLP